MTINDIEIQNHGSVIGFTPLTVEAGEWCREQFEIPEWAWMGPTFYVDHRPAADIINFMLAVCQGSEE
jgi:hypothetical protein